MSAGVKYLQAYGYPVYKFPENAAKSFAALFRFSKWLNRQHLAQYKLKHDKKRAAEVIKGCLAAGKTRLGELDGVELLKCYGLNVLPTKLAKTAKEAISLASEMKYPVVMKIASAQILHKSDAKGVMVGLKSDAEVQKAFDQIVCQCPGV